jgi:hypothetical protein
MLTLPNYEDLGGAHLPKAPVALTYFLVSLSMIFWIVALSAIPLLSEIDTSSAAQRNGDDRL